MRVLVEVMFFDPIEADAWMDILDGVGIASWRNIAIEGPWVVKWQVHPGEEA